MASQELNSPAAGVPTKVERDDTGVYEPVTGYPAGAIDAWLEGRDETRDRLLRLTLPLVLFVVFVVLFMLTLFGCAGDRDPVLQGVDAAQSGLAALSVPVEEAAALHLQAAERVVEICRAELGPDSTEDQRLACVSSYGFAPDDLARRTAAIREFGAAYDAAVGALQRIESNYPGFLESVSKAHRVLERQEAGSR